MTDHTLDYRCGYVALVGRPNVGKSTLMNRILGQKLSIVTAKPQTTRQRIAGIKTTQQGQVIYIDTPGIHLAAQSALNRYMNRIAQASFHEVDLILFLIEAGRWTKQDEHVARSLKSVSAPVLLVVNKIDLVPEKSRLLQFLEHEVKTDRFSEVFLISAKSGNGVDVLEQKAMQGLPFSRPFYDEDQFTDRSERFLAAELIREQLMLRLHQELPYSLTVEIEEFNREDRLLRIGARSPLNPCRGVGTQARHALQELFDEKIFLRLWVKVSHDWSDNERALRQFGYSDQN